MDEVDVAILAAGLGTRLARAVPKALVALDSGETILDRQVRQVRSVFGDASRITVVVGFKLELVMEAVPDAVFAYNELYDRTNTSKSLLKALRAVPRGAGLLWMNGDLVIERGVLEEVAVQVGAGRSCVAVDHAQVGDEEVTYTMRDGFVDRLAKRLPGGVGEAVGVNYVAPQDRAALERRLVECQDQDYFERGIELTIAQDGLRWTPVDISRFRAVEVDFEDDLVRANSIA